MSLTCPACNSDAYYKNGTINGDQRYRCKQCNKSFQAHYSDTRLSEADKALVLSLKAEGLSIRGIARILNKVTHVAVYQFLKKNLPV